MDPILLTINNVRVTFHAKGGVVAAVDDVSFQMAAGETVAVVGESGCGKTTLARAILGLQPMASGSISVAGVEVNGPRLGQATRIGMVWQDPFASIDPRWTIRKIIEEPFVLSGVKPEVERVLDEVGLDSSYAGRYPHQLSGGQRQRAAIGRALALRPPLVICDEPTAALDLSVQAQILNLLKDLRDKLGCSFLYISHDLSTVKYLADRVAVMYMGQIVESGPADKVFEAPRHPYTAGLLASAPSLDRLGELPLATKGETPDPLKLGIGCRYAGRCPRVTPECTAKPVPVERFEDREALCIHPLTYTTAP